MSGLRPSSNDVQCPSDIHFGTLGALSSGDVDCRSHMFGVQPVPGISGGQVQRHADGPCRPGGMDGMTSRRVLVLARLGWAEHIGVGSPHLRLPRCCDDSC